MTSRKPSKEEGHSYTPASFGAAVDATPARHKDRALPGPMLGLIRDGAPKLSLARSGEAAVYSALFRTACSAYQRGQDRIDWVDLVLAPGSVLGQQARTRDGVKVRDVVTLHKWLDDIWDKATIWVSEKPAAFTKHDARRHAGERAAALVNLAADPTNDLRDNERKILVHAADEAVRLAHTTPTLPRLQMLDATGLGLTALRTALRGLQETGLLTLREPGRPRGDFSNKPGSANVYALADPNALAHYLNRVPRSVVPPNQTCGAPRIGRLGAPHETCGAPLPTSATTNPQESPDMVTLTLSAPDAEAVVDFLSRLSHQREGNAEGVDQEQRLTSREKTANILPFRRSS